MPVGDEEVDAARGVQAVMGAPALRSTPRLADVKEMESASSMTWLPVAQRHDAAEKDSSVRPRELCQRDLDGDGSPGKRAMVVSSGGGLAVAEKEGCVGRRGCGRHAKTSRSTILSKKL
jgi:hypothetical protein